MKILKKPSGQTWARFAYDFRERAEKAEKERDEALAEIDRLHDRIQHIGASHTLALSLSRKEVAERQREACASEARFYAGLGLDGEKVEEKVRATPLVETED